MSKWVDIKGYEGLYQVSNEGSIRSLDRYVPNKFNYRLVKGKIMKQHIGKTSGLLFVNLSYDNKVTPKLVHRLVAEAFIDNPLNLPQIAFKNDNKKDCNVDNLEWCSASFHLEKTYKNGRKINIPSNKGSKNPSAKLDENKVKEIKLMIKENVSITKIADKYNVSIATISMIKNNKKWRNIT